MIDDPFDTLGKVLGLPDVEKLRRELAAATTRAARAEQKIADVIELCSDPAQSHRTLRRIEILRLLR